MVILLLLFSSILFADTVGTRVQLELSKQEFYQGEQILAQFFVISDLPQVDLEVVKFPEFKGYWSENQALRQGVLPLMPAYLMSNKIPIWGSQRQNGFPVSYKGLIGAYTLTPMLIKKEWKIEPMKVLIREEGLGKEDKILTHEIPAHTILPLPPVPSLFQENRFVGAVGNFTVEVQETDVGFRDNEIAGIRLSLVGNGNFQEIDTLPLSIPAIVEPVSSRSFTQIHAGNGVKSFEWDVNVHSDQSFTVEESGFYYFNPIQKKYVLAKIPKFTFSKLPNLPPPALEMNLETRNLETTWSAEWNLKENALFWILQIMFLLSVLIKYVFIPFRKKRSFKIQHKQSNLKQVEILLKEPNNLILTRNIYTGAINLIEQKLKRQVRHLTHKELMKSLSLELQSIILDLKPIIDSYHSLQFSKEKETLHPPEALKEHLKNLLKKAA